MAIKIKAETAVAVGAAVAVTGALVAASGVLTTRNAAAQDFFSDADIARFLTQATFGPTDADIAAVRNFGSYDAWITDQMDVSKHALFNTVTWAQSRVGKAPTVEAHYAFVEAFWLAIRNPDVTDPANPTGPKIRGPHTDLLRQRVQFALSQHFVVSRENETLEFDGAFGTINYYDLLGRNAFANFRQLIEAITFNPMMGIYLSYIANDKEDPTTGRHPDENYAREIMQLFTIGTVMLNQDGTPKLDSNGNTIPTYTHDDIAGLSKVFTGLSWAQGSFTSGSGYTLPMIWYPTHHSISQKSFLGTTIPASTTPDGPGDLKIALDTLFNHPNVGPFIATRLIKQLVTSNPSPAYVSRVAGVFNDNGSGVRGDMAAVIKAILLDDEARNTAAAQTNANSGKLREPIIRLANWVRAFETKSKNGFFDVEDPYNEFEFDLGQNGVLDPPSVFNFWRPLYIPPHTTLGNQGLSAPEFQAVSELSAAAYVNLMQTTVGSGIGINWKTFSGTDVTSDYLKEIAVAGTSVAGSSGPLLDRLNLLLFYGQMSSTLRTQIQAAVEKIAVSTTSPATGQKNRAKLAIFLSMVSGEYLTQR